MRRDTSRVGVGSRIREGLATLAGLCLIGSWIVGVPVAVLATSWGQPLYQTTTVTTTQAGGFLFTAVMPLFIWGTITAVFWAMATGRLPQPRRI